MRFGLSSEKKVVDWLALLFLTTLVVLPIGLLIWLVFFTDTFTIQAITVVDARPHTEQAVRQLTEKIQATNIFLAATNSVEQRITAEIPQVHTVHIVRKLPGTIKIIVQERVPALLLLSNKQYYFIDEDGIAYEEARLETLPDIVLPVVKNNDQDARLRVGSPAFSSSLVLFVSAMSKQLAQVVGASVAEMRIPSLAAREVHFYLENNWVIRCDTTRSVAGQLATLRRLLDHTITEEEKKSLQYVDLRIANRVYYKTKDTALTKQSTE